MNLRITSGDGVPIYLQIINQLKYLVASNALAAGEQLPPVRKLAETLLVNPNTVQRAYRELESAGIVETRRGAGVFVLGLPSPLLRREKRRILSERIDLLLAEANQMDIKLDDLIELIKNRHEVMNNG